MRAPQFENSPFLFLIHTQISSMIQFANGLLILARPNWPVSYNFYFFKWTQIESKYHQFTSNQHNNSLRLGSGNTDRPFPANRGLTGVNMSFKKSADKKTNPESYRELKRGKWRTITQKVIKRGHHRQFIEARVVSSFQIKIKRILATSPKAWTRETSFQ